MADANLRYEPLPIYSRKQIEKAFENIHFAFVFCDLLIDPDN